MSKNNFMDLVTTITKKKIPCVFISPHYDDAVLSCGSLLSALSGKTDITIVNVFTKANSGPYTLSAKQFLKTSGVTDAVALYKERKEEDKMALSSFSVKIINIDLEDALFRRKKMTSLLGKLLPEFDHVYPTYRWHILKKIIQKDPAIKELSIKLASYKNKKNLIFAPYGIGDHVDHKIVRTVCEAMFHHVILYSDFPYNIRLNTYGRTLKNGQEYHLIPDMKKKIQLIKKYKTQYSGLFDKTVPEHEEVFFSNKPL